MADSLSFVTAGDGAQIAFRIDGPSDKPTLILSNSIATTLHMWDGQIAELSRHFRVIRYDTRGHGASSVPAGAYSLDRLGRDVLELMDALEIARTHFLGLSLGGFIGQWLGIYAPERIDRLILSNTSSYLGPAKPWDETINTVLQSKDMTERAEIFLRNWFPAHMLQAGGPAIEHFRAMVLSTSRPGLAGNFAVIRDSDLRRTISLITRPTLVIAGEHDPVTAASHGRAIADTIPGAELKVLPTVHLPNVELPDEYIQTVLGFLRAAASQPVQSASCAAASPLARISLAVEWHCHYCNHQSWPRSNQETNPHEPSGFPRKNGVHQSHDV